MKVKMLETTQGTGIRGVLFDEGIDVTILEVAEVYTVDAQLGAWLIENSKAKEIFPKVYAPKLETQKDEVPQNEKTNPEHNNRSGRQRNRHG